jgi:small subunit ribosomal protein S4
MGRYTGALCRLCRREGEKLFLKGAKCVTDKCPVSKRQYAPGQHGKMRKKLSNYGIQLREKQKVKRIYGLMEKQFRILFARAERQKGITGEILLQLLERRLDNAIFRLGCSTSRQQARQIVRHGHVKVNGRKVNIPSFTLKPHDIIELKGKDKFFKGVKETLEVTKERGLPDWVKFDRQNYKAEILDVPKREDVGFPIQEQLIVELYSK